MRYTTKLLTDSPADIAVAAELLRRGEAVGIPTETVYGLAADATNEAAVAKIFAAKGRPQDNPLIVHVAAFEEIEPLVAAIPDTARRLADAFWPGPLTMIFPRSSRIPASVCGGLDTVGIRLPAHPVARALIRQSGRPLAAPSGNLSGRPSPTTAAHMLEDMNGRIPAIVDGGESGVGLESTVISLTEDAVRILRPGGITPDMLKSVVTTVDVDPAVTAPLETGAKAASPGMKYKHYAPRAKVTLLRGGAAAFAAYVNARAGEHPTALCFDGEEGALTVPTLTYGKRRDAAEQAHRLFDALRRLDEEGATRVYAACPAADGVGLAVYNRILRAAGFEVIDLDG
ncbi:MAG: L-threonylcarbamoyladenylate synthase [Acutalibacteraceae bacterium]|jgi:L-threonylcarbamoyladenylate synthase